MDKPHTYTITVTRDDGQQVYKCSGFDQPLVLREKLTPEGWDERAHYLGRSIRDAIEKYGEGAQPPLVTAIDALHRR